MSEGRDPLQCTFEDAERNHLRDGMRMSVRAKIEFFEEMLDLAWRSGAAQRAERQMKRASSERQDEPPADESGKGVRFI